MIRPFFICLFLLNTWAVAVAQQESDRSQNYTLLGHKAHPEIPFEFNGMNLMVKARLNGIKVKLQIDNGVMWDEAWFYGNDQVDSLGFVYEEDVTIEGAGEGEGIESKTANCPDIYFDDIVFHHQRALVSPKEQGFASFFPGVAGQICGTLFRNFIVEFDFDRQVITLYDPNDFTFNDDGSALKMSRDTSGSYSIPVSVKVGDKKVSMDIFIDLGGIYPLSLVLNDDIKLNGEAEETVLGYGASGEIRGYKAGVDQLSLGKYKLKDVPAVFIEDESGGDFTNMTIGLPSLMKFKLVFDYFHDVLYISPNQNFNKDFDKP